MSEPDKILCFINDKDGSRYQIVAMALNGDVLRSIVCATLEEGKASINNDESKALYGARFPDGYRAVWIDNPSEHAEAREASRLFAAKAKPEEPRQPTPAEMKAIFESQHLCRLCSHQPMCGIALAIDQQAEREEYVVLGGCTMLDLTEETV